MFIDSISKFYSEIGSDSFSNLLSIPVFTLTLFRCFELGFIKLRSLANEAQMVVSKMLFVDEFVELKDIYDLIFTSKTQAEYLFNLVTLSISNSTLALLKKYHLLQGKETKVWLNPVFSTCLKKLFFSFDDYSNGNFSFLARPTSLDAYKLSHSFISTFQMTSYNFLRIHYRSEMFYLLQKDAFIKQLLLTSGCLKSTNVITSTGFQFVLENVQNQLWILLSAYFTEMPFDEKKQVILLLSMLAWTEPFLDYSNENLSSFQKKCISELRFLGMICPPAGGQDDRFYVTPLSLSLFKKDLQDTSKGLLSNQPTVTTGYLIIETNYRVYAMTNSTLHISILSLFISLKNYFPGMVTGTLSRESVQKAFEKGLSASQILSFFRSVAHPSQIKSAIDNQWPTAIPPTIEDQLFLWEQEKFRIVASPAFLYTGFSNNLEYDQIVTKATSSNCLLACSHPVGIAQKSQIASIQRRHLVVSEDGHASLRKDLNR